MTSLIPDLTFEIVPRLEPSPTVALTQPARRRMLPLLALGVFLLLAASGCGTSMARLMVKAPNSYPQWLGGTAPVLLNFSPAWLTNFPRHFVAVGPPSAQLCYRIVPPADYGFKMSSTNWQERGETRTEFFFDADLSAPTNQWTARPRGTVVLLHGYALAQFSMAPWAIRLAQDGWRCVLVDLRGHGRSTGKRIYYGLREPQDLSELLDQLARDGELIEPVAAMGESYGAAMALRWQAQEPRIRSVVAIAPYNSLSNAVMNLRSDYADWLPKSLVRAGIRQLPVKLDVVAADLDTSTAIARNPHPALFVAAARDRIAPPPEVEQLAAVAGHGSKYLLVPDATHETVTYFFPELTQPILDWLARTSPP
jgi:pimeloyl-ACP methyl ester carboxylesterase